MAVMVSSNTQKREPFFPLSKRRLGEFQISFRRLIDDHEILDLIKREGPDVGKRFLLILLCIAQDHLCCEGSQGSSLKGRSPPWMLIEGIEGDSNFESSR